MATVNITGAGAPAGGSGPPVQAGDPGTTSAPDTLGDAAFQAQLKNVRFIMSLRERDSARELTAIRTQNSEMLKGETARSNLEQQTMRKQQKDAQYILGVRMNAIAKENTAQTKRQNEALAAQKKQQRDDEKAQQQKVKDADKAQREVRRTEREAEKEARKVERAERQRTTEAQKEVRKGERAERQKAREADEADRAIAAAKRQRLNNFARAGRTGAMALNSVHGDFEGATTAIGGGVGALLGGGAGFEIGAIAGEIIGKVGEAIAALPLAPGNLWNKFTSVTAPYLDQERSASDLGAAGGYRATDLMDRMQARGSYQARDWQRYTGMTSADAYAAINATGIAPQGADAALAMAQDIGTFGKTTGYRGLPRGAIEGVLGQGLNQGNTNPATQREYLGQIGTTLSKALPMDIDRSKLLGRMADAIETLSKGGSAGVSAGSVSELFQRFMMAGGPGRGGENAMAAIAGTNAVLDNPSANPATMYGYQQIAQRFGGLKTDDQIKAALGDKAWTALQSNPSKDLYLKNIRDAGAAGNYFAQSQYMGQLFKGDTGRYNDLINDAFPNLPSYLKPIVAGNVGGDGPIPDMLQQNQRGKTGGGGGAKGGPTGFADWDAETQNARVRMQAGIATDADKAKVLGAFGVPSGQIDPMIKAAGKAGIDPLLLATQVQHESNYNPFATHKNVSKTGQVSWDVGLGQINTFWQRKNPLMNLMNPFETQSNLDTSASNLVDPKTGLQTARRYNPNDPFATHQVESTYDNTKAPAPAVADAVNADKASATFEGARREFELFEPVMKKVNSSADQVATSLDKLAGAADRLFAAFSANNGGMPPPGDDLASRLGGFLSGSGQGLKALLPIGIGGGL